MRLSRDQESEVASDYLRKVAIGQPIPAPAKKQYNRLGKLSRLAGELKKSLTPSQTEDVIASLTMGTVQISSLTISQRTSLKLLLVENSFQDLVVFFSN